MPWKIEYKQSVVKSVKKLSPEIQKRLRTFIEERIASLDDPRSQGKALTGKQDIWRYRAGDYRILTQIKDNQIVILVIDIGHRSSIYKKLSSQK